MKIMRCGSITNETYISDRVQIMCMLATIGHHTAFNIEQLNFKLSLMTALLNISFDLISVYYKLFDAMLSTTNLINFLCNQYD